MTTSKKKTRNLLIGIAVAIAAAGLSAFIGVNAYNHAPAQRLSRQLDLGQRYLSELNYEAAVAAFTKAIAIEPRSEEEKELLAQAREGLADAYGDWSAYYERQQEYEMAIARLDEALAVLPENEALRTKEESVYLAWSEVLLAGGEYARAAEILQEGSQKLGSVKLSEKLQAAQALQEEKEEKKYEELLQPLLEAYQKGDIEALHSQFVKKEYADMAQTLEAGESYYYGAYDANGKRDGEGVAIYAIGSEKTPFVYAGDWDKDIRSGQAWWVRETGYYDCTFARDKPSGSGKYECFWEYCMNKGLIDQFYSGDVYCAEFNTINGLYDGVYRITHRDYDAPERIYEKHYDKGYIQVLGNDILADGKKWYRIGISAKGEYKWCKEEYLQTVNGIEGFSE